jgi:hypothetical protein
MVVELDDSLNVLRGVVWIVYGWDVGVGKQRVVDVVDSVDIWVLLGYILIEWRIMGTNYCTAGVYWMIIRRY